MPYIWDGPDGAPTTQKLNETISNNFILANYHSSMAIDKCVAQGAALTAHPCARSNRLTFLPPPLPQ